MFPEMPSFHVGQEFPGSPEKRRHNLLSKKLTFQKYPPEIIIVLLEMKEIEICCFQISLTWLTAVMSVGFIWPPAILQRFQGWGGVGDQS